MSLFPNYRLHWLNQHQLPEPQILFQEMDAWLQSPLGRELLAIEEEMLEPILARVFGYHILQLGCCTQSMLGESPVGHKFFFTPFHTTGSRFPVASNEFLPLSNESVDAVLIHHALDFTPDSHRLLREAARVVMPGGKLLIIGFNPASTWGLRKVFQWKNSLPWSGRFISSGRVCDWLKLLDFSIDKVAHSGYLLPVNNLKMVAIAQKLEGLGRRFQLPVGAVYSIVACKQVMPMTPIVPRWPRIPRPVIVRPVGEVTRTHKETGKSRKPVSG